MGCKRSQVQILPPRPLIWSIPMIHKLLRTLTIVRHSQIIQILFKKLTILNQFFGANSMINAFTATIHGRVQGVGFRFYVQNKAISLNVTGWTRNSPEGTVEILANGSLN